MDETASFTRLPSDGDTQDSVGRDAAPVVLDLRGLKCPLPVLRTRKALRPLEAGRVLQVLCTDPLAAIDIPNLVREDGHVLCATTRADAISAFVIRKRQA